MAVAHKFSILSTPCACAVLPWAVLKPIIQLLQEPAYYSKNYSRIFGPGLVTGLEWQVRVFTGRTWTPPRVYRPEPWQRIFIFICSSPCRIRIRTRVPPTTEGWEPVLYHLADPVQTVVCIYYYRFLLAMSDLQGLSRNWLYLSFGMSYTLYSWNKLR